VTRDSKPGTQFSLKSCATNCSLKKLEKYIIENPR